MILSRALKIYLEEINNQQISNMVGQIIAKNTKNPQDKEKLKEELKNNFLKQEGNSIAINNIIANVKNVDKMEKDKEILMWIIENIISKEISIDRFQEDEEQISNALKFFFKNRSIFTKKRLKDNKFSEIKTLSLKGVKKVDNFKFSNEEAEKLYEDNNHVLWIPKTHNASCQLGSQTTWCTAANSSASLKHFQNYTKDGPLFILINKQTNDKWQFHKESRQYMDKADQNVNINKVLYQENVSDDIIKKLKSYGYDVINIRTLPEEKQTETILKTFFNIKSIIKQTPDGIIVAGDLSL